ncbi:unnamed protein product [Durusdinium trenchii]|uniref:Uncharacterized protein n=1 Tax=Durusdinium trenchii TaxID=1381693 RepID=A0ABP0KGA8_9DINO
MDAFFTGGDFASCAMDQLKGAIKHRLDWFAHENVQQFPAEVLTPLHQWYGEQSSLISPQRFGKPLNRLRIYRLFFRKNLYTWHGPSMRQILKLTCPLKPLNLTSDSLYYMTNSELVSYSSKV